MKKKLRILSLIMAIAMACSVVTIQDLSAKSKPDPNKLKAPKITVKGGERYDVTVKWNNVPGAQQYYLYRSTKKTKKYVLIASGSVSTRNFYEDTLKAGKKYYYKVKETGTVDGVYKDGNFSKPKYKKIKKGQNGNAKKYDLNKVKYKGSSAITGRTIVFVGSSFTQGVKSKNQSFPEFIAKRNKCNVIKSGIGGTTVANTGSNSIFARTINLCNTRTAPSALVCQLSANDATKNVPIGNITANDKRNLEDFNTRTTAGAIEYIICYSDQKWGCPVAFFTNIKFNNSRYPQIRNILYQAQKKWGIQVIDLYSGLGRKSVSAKKFRLYMADRLHPTKAGYLKWVTPFFEARLGNLVKSGSRLTIPEDPPIGDEPIIEEPVEQVPEEIVENTEKTVEQPEPINQEEQLEQ